MQLLVAVVVERVQIEVDFLRFAKRGRDLVVQADSIRVAGEELHVGGDEADVFERGADLQELDVLGQLRCVEAAVAEEQYAMIDRWARPLN